MFTFKKYRPVGRYESEHSDIKLDGNIVGVIEEVNDNRVTSLAELFSVSFMKVNSSQKSDFRWITLKKKFNSDKSARDFLKENFETIIKQFDLFKLSK
jgi:hypothetical protein